MAKPKLYLLLITLCCILSCTTHAGWFTHDEQPYKQQIHDLQAQVIQQTHQNNQMVVVIIILATGVIIALVVGAGIGSKARKAAKEVGN